MLEELIIKIKSIMDNDGFRKAETSMRNFDGTTKKAMQEASAHAGSFGTGLDKAGTKTDALIGKIKNMGPAMAAAGAAGLAAIGMFYYKAIEAAATAEERWGRFTVTLGKTGLQIGEVQKEWQPLVDSMKSNTGRGQGGILDIMGGLSMAGIKNKAIMQGAVENITGMAYLKQTTPDAIASSYERIVKSGMASRRTLNAVGVGYDTLDKVMKKHGLTIKDYQNLSEEQRASMLSEAMATKNTAEANKAYKESYAGMMDQLNQIWQGAFVAIGKELLPVLKDVMEILIPILKKALAWFKELPGPIKTAIVLLPLVLAGLMLIGGLIFSISSIVGAFDAMALSLFGVEGAAAAAMTALAPLLALAAIGIVIYVSYVEIKDKVAPRIDKRINTGKPKTTGQILDIAGYEYKNNWWLNTLNPLMGPGMQSIGKSGIADWKGWPTAEQWINALVPSKGIVDNFKWPTVDQILKGLKTEWLMKIARLVWPSLNLGTFGAWIIPKIDSLKFPNINTVGNWIYNAIQRAVSGSIPSSVGGSARAAAGDTNSMNEYKSLGFTVDPYTGQKTTINAPINIGNIDSKSTADYFAQQIAIHLNSINNANGR